MEHGPQSRTPFLSLPVLENNALPTHDDNRLRSAGRICPWSDMSCCSCTHRACKWIVVLLDGRKREQIRFADAENITIIFLHQLSTSATVSTPALGIAPAYLHVSQHVNPEKQSVVLLPGFAIPVPCCEAHTRAMASLGKI